MLGRPHARGRPGVSDLPALVAAVLLALAAGLPSARNLLLAGATLAAVVWIGWDAAGTDRPGPRAARHGHTKTFSCVTGKRFTIWAGKTGSVKTRVSRKCLRALRFAHHHRIQSTLLVTFTTGQHKLEKTVTLLT